MKFLIGLSSVLFFIFIYFIKFNNFNPTSSITRATNPVSDFVLMDHNGETHKLYYHSDAKAIVIIGFGNSCPIVQKYSKRINELNDKFRKFGVVFLMIDPNIQDSRDDITAEAKDYGIQLPILMDPSQIVTKSLGLTRTSEVVIINPKNWEIIYRGAIDDRIGFEVDKQIAQNNYLEDAITNILNGKTSDFNIAAAKGCAYSFFDTKEKISYTKTIAPIVKNKCLSCHNQGGKYPPELNSHKKLLGWSRMIKETIFTERMPPHSADPYYGEYITDVTLTSEEKRLLIQWIDQGLPKDGNTDELSKFNVDQNNSGKNKLLKPIFEADMPIIQKIPPKGLNKFKYYQIAGPLKQDMWINSILTTPTNARQVHHEALIVTSQPLEFYENIMNKYIQNNILKGQTESNMPVYLGGVIDHYEKKNNNNYIKFFTWGIGIQQPTNTPIGSRVFFPKGSYLILEAHYGGTGKDDEDSSNLKFYGSTKKPVGTKNMAMDFIYQNNFEIPANVKKYLVTSEPVQLKKDITIKLLVGHLHLRGRSLKLIQIDKNGNSNIVFSIPNFYNRWQVGSGIIPQKPLKFTKDTKLQIICEYDNSEFNPNNPNPKISVKYGQTTDQNEMCVLFYIYDN